MASSAIASILHAGFGRKRNAAHARRTELAMPPSISLEMAKGFSRMTPAAVKKSMY
jgi:hypothetical protein